MSSDPSPDSAVAGAPHPAPGLPKVHDEAADTPIWVPIVGISLFLFLGVWLLMAVASRGDDTATAGDGGVVDGQVADGAETSDGGAAPAN